MNKYAALLATCLSLGLTTACSHQHMMRTPTVVAQGHLDPFVDTADAERRTMTPVFVVSAREPSGRTAPSRFYSNNRSRVLRLGQAEVELGNGADWDRLETLSRERSRGAKVTIKLKSFEEYGVLWTTVPPPDLGFDRDWTAPDATREPADRFVAAIDDQLRASGGQDIYLFVHGFNTSYSNNLGIAAELWHYLGRQGAMISFAWPSKHNVFEYQADKADAAYATRQFRKLLTFLAAETEAQNINIIAHSAGNPIVVEALRDLRLMHYDTDAHELQRTTRIGRVILAAPDMDLLQAINAMLDGFEQCADSIVLYASTSDVALDIASLIFHDTRLGASVKRLTPDEREALTMATSFEAVDVSYAQKKHGSFLGHSYFHHNPWVSSDLSLYLTLGQTPAERGLTRDEDTGFWVFPKDYAKAMASRNDSQTVGSR